MSDKTHCFLYLENNTNPELVESALNKHTDEYEKINDNLYLYSGFQHLFAMELISLHEGILYRIQDTFEANNVKFETNFLTGHLDATYHSFI